MELPAPRLVPFAAIRATLGPPLVVGQAKAGLRRIIPITGGRVEGRLSGQLLNLGADWQTVFADGSAELDTRYAIQTDDGALIDIRNFGYRHGPPEVMARLAARQEVDPAEYYMRTRPAFETADPRYQWLTRTLFVGTGARQASSVRIELYEVA